MTLVANDVGLLRRYAEMHDEAAFAAVVRENISLVYSAALRRVGEPQLAEDVTQAVFMILAKKAKSFRHDKPGKPLSAWLLTAVRYAAANAIKIKARREKHEHAAASARAAGAASHDPSEVLVWQEIASRVDDAVLKLPDLDRRVVLLRYFEERAIHDIAADLNVSEGAVKQRLARALEKLRARLDRAGGCVGAISIEQFARMLASHAAAPAPAGLAHAVCAAAIHGGAGAATGITIAKGAMHMMNWTKLKFAAAVVTVATITGTGGVLTLNRAMAQDAPVAKKPAPKKSAKNFSVAAMPPVVVKTVPQSGDTEVDAESTTELRVTFSKEMTDGNWSWAQVSDDTFPKINGKTHYDSDNKTCILPVKLEPGKAYVIRLNFPPFDAFSDTMNHKAVPYLLVFETKK